MNLLYVTGTFPKTSETFVRNEVEAQLRAGHAVRVVSLRRPEAGSVADVPPEVLITVPRAQVVSLWPVTATEWRVPEERWTRKVYATAAARWVADRLGGFRPDVVHAHFANLPALVAGHLSALLGVPYSFMAHATDYRLKMSDDLLRRRVLHAGAVFVVSDAARREISSRATLTPAEQRRLDVVRAAVHLHVPPPDPDAGRSGDTAPALRVVSVARHVPMKGLDLALHAFARLRPAYPDARYDLVGDGPERRMLQSLAAALAVDDAVTFHGRLENRLAQQITAAADVALLPCRHDQDGAADGLPVFLMEAGALAIPVVTTAVSGIPELVRHGEGGLIVPGDDVDAIAAALLRLAADSALRRRLGEGLHARVHDEFTAQRQVQRLHARWARMIASNAAGQRDTAARPSGTGAATQRQRLSVVIVARDEADAIERCVRGSAWADEVLVAVDSATTDDTAARARAAGAQVRSVQWRGFSATKNDAAKLASHDWVLSLDADEVVSTRLRRRIVGVLSASPDPREGFALERRSDFLGVLLPNDTRAATRRSAVRLFHRAHGSWDEGMDVHEVVHVPGRVHPLPGILVQWRDFDLDELLTRFNRYATVEAQQLARAGRRVHAVDVVLRPIARFAWHYLARGEFRLGARGLVHSGLKAAGEYMRCAKLWELRHPPSAAGEPLARALRDN